MESERSGANMPLPVLLDTDIGDDIDDAFALALLLNSPEIELLGVTTVFRNAPRRGALARKMLRLWKREDVEIGAGVSKPLLQPFSALRGGAQLGRQFEVLTGEDEISEDESAPPFGHAVDLMRRGAEAASPEAPVTFLCIGPLSNAALFCSLYPELLANVRVTLMGGLFAGDIGTARPSGTFCATQKPPPLCLIPACSPTSCRLM
jgi:purine nucleosidase/pyrimidine-specific ribonucleoside hydrolase